MRRLLPLLSLLPSMLFAFGEEHGSDIDTRGNVSTHHLYLTRALAVCAGLPSSGKADLFEAPREAERIAIADQLSDSERIARRAGPESHTNCSAKPYAMPTPAALGCAAGTGTASVMPVLGDRHFTALTPVPKWQPGAGCFTSRFGPYSNDFHFPDAARIEVLRRWAFGDTATLAGTARFSFGGWLDSPWGADCNAKRAEIIDTGNVAPGSPEALGTYLHAIGDYHSHAECLAHWGDRGSPPWPTHTISTSQTGCAFIDHAREFGCPSRAAHDSALTPPPGETYVAHAVQAALDVEDALVAWARAHGVAPRLAETPENRAWLATQARRFVTGWSYLGGAKARREFANAIANTCAAIEPGSAVPVIPPAAGEADCPRK